MATTRTIIAPNTNSGSGTVDLELLGIDVDVDVVVDPAVTAVEITVSTSDDTGASADSVTAAQLHWDPQNGILVAHVQGNDANSGTTVTTGSGRGMSVFQTAGTVHGQMTGMVISGDMNIVNGRVVGGGQALAVQRPAPVTIQARVPAASMVIARTQSAAVRTTGPLHAVAATTQSGAVAVDASISVHAQTMSGSVGVRTVGAIKAQTMTGSIQINQVAQSADLSTMAGSIRAHVTGTGVRLAASSMSGNVSITAAPHAVDSLTVRATSMSGRASTPR